MRDQLTSGYRQVAACAGRPAHGTKFEPFPMLGASGAFGRDGHRMRLFLRLLGTWLLGLALILLVIDGTKSLGASRLVLTSLAENWGWLHAESLEAVRGFVASRFFGLLLAPGFETVIALPGWVVLAVPGVLLAWLGRSRKTRLFVRHDQI